MKNVWDENKRKSLTTDLTLHENKSREMEGITRETNYNKTLKDRKINRV